MLYSCCISSYLPFNCKLRDSGSNSEFYALQFLVMCIKAFLKGPRLDMKKAFVGGSTPEILSQGESGFKNFTLKD